MMKTKRKTPTKRNQAKASSPRHKEPLVKHLHEVKRRLFYVVGAVLVGSILAYGLERRLIEVLLRPSHGQQFIYTSPLGGMNFLFGVCLDIGLILATPVIIYNLLAFLKPLLGYTTHRFLFMLSGVATFVALGGVVFGYFIGLPSALHFLLNQFVTVQVKPLLTIQAYVSFVAIYLLGSALMFQLPLIILFINRIKPLKPGTLLKYERHAVFGAFIIAFIMNPTPNLVDQLIVIIPIFVMYQVSIILVWLVNRQQVNGFDNLLAADLERQAQRLHGLVQASRLRLDDISSSLHLQPATGLIDEGLAEVNLKKTVNRPGTPIRRTISDPSNRYSTRRLI